MNNHPDYPRRQICKINGELLDEKIYYAKCMEFTHPSVIKNMNSTSGLKWADEENPDIDILEERETFMGSFPGSKTLAEAGIKFNKNNKPMNPVGWTGLAGRGLLGKWGPNHAADPIVAYLDENESLWAIVIRRKDTGEWAIPGGMVDSGDNVSQTLINEIFQEAIENDENDENDENVRDGIIDLFHNAIVLYEGYVNDPRNTDNSWMETTVSGILISEEQKLKINLRAEDTENNTDSTKWIRISQNSEDFVNLYADHKFYLLLMQSAVKGMQYNKKTSDILEIKNLNNNQLLIVWYLLVIISMLVIFIAYLISNLI